MPRQGKRPAEALLLSASVASLERAPVASTSSAMQSTPERRSKRRKIEGISTASTSTSDVVSSAARTQHLLAKKRTRKAKLAAETKNNALLASCKGPAVKTKTLVMTAQDVSGPPTPESVINELLDTSGTEGASPAEDQEILQKIALLEQQLKEKDQQLETQRKVFDTIQQQVQCQICLDNFVQPYTLVPCGHTSCLGCLQQWFNTSNAGANADLFGPIPVTRRKKTCPHCRTQVVQRPVAARLIKSITSEVAAGLAATAPRVSPAVANLPANDDPWKDIFPAERHGANRAADGAFIDHEDGGIRRCVHCMTEIWHGVCQGCGEEYDEPDFSDDDLELPFPQLEIWEQNLLPGQLQPWWEHQRGRYEEDEDEDDEMSHPDEDDEGFINDGEVDYDEDDRHTPLSDEDEERLALPLFRGSPPRRRYTEMVQVIDVDDSEEEEEIPLAAPVPRRAVARVRGQIIVSDDEESVEELLSEDEEELPARVGWYQAAPLPARRNDQGLAPGRNNFQGVVHTYHAEMPNLDSDDSERIFGLDGRVHSVGHQNLYRREEDNSDEEVEGYQQWNGGYREELPWLQHQMESDREDDEDEDDEYYVG